MIPDLQASLLCDDVRQEKNGKFILIGIFDGLVVPKFPFGLARLCVVNRWCCGQGQFNQRTRIVGPDVSQVLVEGKNLSLSLNSDNRVYTAIEFFVNLRFERSGTYWVEVSLDRNLKIRYPLHVRSLPASAPGKDAEFPA